MAANKARKKSTVVWVDISLTKTQAESMKIGYSEEAALFGDLERLLDSGYKVTLSADAYNDCMACFIIPKSEENVNFGMILTARGSDWLKALRGALYRHFQLFAADKWTDHEKQVIDSD